MRPRLRRIATAFVVLLAAYAAAVGYLFVFQRDYVFKPGGALAAPEEKGLAGIKVIALTMADGTELTGWHRPAESGRPTILYFHGNAGNIASRAERFRLIAGAGFGLLAVSYRGFSGSGGSPSEAAFFSDGLETFDWLAARTLDIVIFGESLGTGVATRVAAEREAKALILEAPFTAALDIAAETYPWVPVGLLMRDPFLSREHIANVEEPLLIVHGTEDRVVPVEMGRRLFDLAREPKSLTIVEGGTHHDLWRRGLWETALGFLQDQGVIARP